MQARTQGGGGGGGGGGGVRDEPPFWAGYTRTIRICVTHSVLLLMPSWPWEANWRIVVPVNQY